MGDWKREKQTFLQRWRINKRVELLRELVPLIEDKIIVDVGGNDGFLEQQLKLDAILCDKELDLLGGVFSSILCDATKLLFRKNVVSVVICSHTLRDLNPILALMEFEFVLEKQCLCILIVPYSHPYWKLRRFTLPFEHKPFDMKRMRTLLVKN